MIIEGESFYRFNLNVWRYACTRQGILCIFTVIYFAATQKSSTFATEISQ